MPEYRIKEINYKHHTEYWVEKRFTLLGLTLWWSKTTIPYFSRFGDAVRHLEDERNGPEFTFYHYI